MTENQELEAWEVEVSDVFYLDIPTSIFYVQAIFILDKDEHPMLKPIILN
jgi:hypothetical protein